MCLTKQYLIKNQCKCSCPIRKLKNNFTLSQNKPKHLQRETDCHSLLLVGFQQCVEYPLAQLVCLPYAMQVKSDGFIRNRETFGKKLITFGFCPRLWLLSELHHPGPVAGHCEVQHKVTDLTTWISQCLAVYYSLTALSPNALRIRRVDAVATSTPFFS